MASIISRRGGPPKIFVSYRRADSRSATDRIYADLANTFGGDNVFKDIEDIPPGSDFREVLNNALTECDIALIIMGNQWVSIKDSDGNQRLFNEGDWVRQEVASALARDDVKTIPIMVEGAPPPSADQLPDPLKALAYRNVMQVRNDPDYDVDIGRLMQALDPKGKFYEPPTTTSGFSTRTLIAAVILTAVVLIGAIIALSVSGNDHETRVNAAQQAIDNPEGQTVITANETSTESVTGIAFKIWLYEGTGEEVLINASVPNDAYIRLYDGEEVIEENDDCQEEEDTLDACIEFIAAIDQTYAIIVSDNANESITGSITLTTSTE